MICLFLGAVLCGGTAAAQHTLGVTGGYGYGNARFYPDQETRAVWGCYTAGVTWRYYGPQRFVGGFGIDFEYLQRGFSFLQNPTEEDPAKYQWYTRRVKSLMLPIVWQPHFYMLRNHVRIYLEAAATFSYNISSTYENEQARANGSAGWKGDYPFKLARDNRWGYGLAGGGYSDIVRNRNKYYDNNSDGAENPFWATPLRSPLDNLMISVGLNYRFNKQGFEAWKPRPKKEKNREVFKFGL